MMLITDLGVEGLKQKLKDRILTLFFCLDTGIYLRNFHLHRKHRNHIPVSHNDPLSAGNLEKIKTCFNYKVNFYRSSGSITYTQFPLLRSWFWYKWLIQFLDNEITSQLVHQNGSHNLPTSHSPLQCAMKGNWFLVLPRLCSSHG